MLLLKIWSLFLLLCSQFTLAQIEFNDPIILRDSTNVVKVTEENYKTLSRGVNGYFSVLYITMRSQTGGKYDCPMCLEFEKVYRKISTTILNQQPSAKVLFYIADVHDVPTMINDLELKNVPHVVIYNPPEESKEFEWSISPFYQYKLSDKSLSDNLHYANFIAQLLQINISVDQDFDTNEFVIYFMLFIIIFVAIKKIILPKIKNKSKVLMVSLSFLILLTSICGYKFTAINNIPLIARDDKGNIMFFSGSTHWQFGIEIFSVSGMYIIMSGLTLSLIFLNKLESMDGMKRNALAISFVCTLIYTFQYFISCYHIKDPGYPF